MSIYDEPTGSRLANVVLFWTVLVPVILIIVGMSVAIGAFLGFGLVYSIGLAVTLDGLALWIPSVFFGTVGAATALFMLYIVVIDNR